MPEFAGQSLEGELPFKSQEMGVKDWPFYTGDTSIMADGRISNFLSISMPYPAYDSLAWGTVKAYEPFAASFLMQWNQLGKDGILIDLRNNAGSATHRADFQLGARGSALLPIPLVFLWDAGSAYRAASFIGGLRLLREFSCRFTGGEDGLTNGLIGRQDCFKSAPPSLDPL
ncbi:MAG: hypothetical protein ABUL46_05930 [Chitinophaga rupis]